jgi:hypothetical protein
MALLHARDPRRAELERAANRGKAAERAEADAARRADARLEAEVERALLAKREAAEAEAKLSPAERTDRRRRALEQSPPRDLSDYPKLPKGWLMAREAVLRRWKEKDEQEQRTRERRDGTAKRRERFDAEQERIRANCAAKLQAERERHKAEEQRHDGELRSIHKNAEDELKKLGERP